MMLSPVEIRDLMNAVEAMCRRAGEIQMSHFRRLAGYEKKGAIDLLTIADKQSEAAIVEMIQARFPEHRILAEEGGSIGGASDSEYLWVIDPLDGTTNFAHGMPLFASSVAVQHRGETVAGGVIAPALGEMFLAGRGAGAFRNGERLGVSKVDVLNDALVVTGFPYDRHAMLDWLTGMVGEFLSRSQGLLRLGAAALDLAFVAAGNLDGFYERNLHPWDTAAGALLVEEAGGRMSTFNGEPYDIYSNQMLASNGRIHDEMVATLGTLTTVDEHV